jgi:murein DD-endopeptidase MepM/ murein hydrolase activator NlpD
VRARRRLVAVCLAVAAALPSLAVPPAGAQTAADKNRVDSQIGAAQAQVDTASAEEERLLAQIEQSTKAKNALDAKVAGFDGQIAGVQRDLDAAQSRLSALQAQQTAVEARLADSKAALATAKAELARQAIAAYTGRTEAADYAAMLLGSNSLGDVASRRSYMRAVVGSQSDTIATTEHLRDQVGDLDRQVAASKTEAQGQRDLVDSQRASLQASRDAQAAARQEVQGQIAQTDKLKDEVIARKDEFEAQVENLQAESAAIAETLRQRAAAAAAAATTTTAPAAAAAQPGAATTKAPAKTTPAPSPAKAPGRLLIPVPGAPITSPFGYRIHPIYGTSRLHTGIDYGADEGTPIRAAADGVVVSAGWLGGYGNATIIDHGGGIATLYGHQSVISVSEGQKITQGQIIGRVGCTGDCTGPHVHFEVRLNGDPVDPVNYI